MAAGVEQLVIKTLSGGAAARVYERAGFRAIERAASASASRRQLRKLSG